MCYYCRACDAYVGCHKNSRLALGTMANKALRKKRMEVHSIIDRFWKRGEHSRGEVYARLADIFGETVHVGQSDMDRCDRIIEASKRLFEAKPPTAKTNSN